MEDSSETGAKKKVPLSKSSSKKTKKGLVSKSSKITKNVPSTSHDSQIIIPQQEETLEVYDYLELDDLAAEISDIGTNYQLGGVITKRIQQLIATIDEMVFNLMYIEPVESNDQCDDIDEAIMESIDFDSMFSRSHLHELQKLLKDSKLLLVAKSPKVELESKILAGLKSITQALQVYAKHVEKGNRAKYQQVVPIFQSIVTITNLLEKLTGQHLFPLREELEDSCRKAKQALLEMSATEIPSVTTTASAKPSAKQSVDICQKMSSDLSMYNLKTKKSEWKSKATILSRKMFGPPPTTTAATTCTVTASITAATTCTGSASATAIATTTAITTTASTTVVNAATSTTSINITGAKKIGISRTNASEPQKKSKVESRDNSKKAQSPRKQRVIQKHACKFDAPKTPPLKWYERKQPESTFKGFDPSTVKKNTKVLKYRSATRAVPDSSVETMVGALLKKAKEEGRLSEEFLQPVTPEYFPDPLNMFTSPNSEAGENDNVELDPRVPFPFYTEPFVSYSAPTTPRPTSTIEDGEEGNLDLSLPVPFVSHSNPTSPTSLSASATNEGGDGKTRKNILPQNRLQSYLEGKPCPITLYSNPDGSEDKKIFCVGGRERASGFEILTSVMLAPDKPLKEALELVRRLPRIPPPPPSRAEPTRYYIPSDPKRKKIPIPNLLSKPRVRYVPKNPKIIPKVIPRPSRNVQPGCIFSIQDIPTGNVVVRIEKSGDNVQLVCLKEEEASLTSLKEGEASPTSLKEGEASPTSLKEGEASPTSLKEGEASPSCLKEGDSSPKCPSDTVSEAFKKLTIEETTKTAMKSYQKDSKPSTSKSKPSESKPVDKLDRKNKKEDK